MGDMKQPFTAETLLQEESFLSNLTIHRLYGVRNSERLLSIVEVMVIMSWTQVMPNAVCFGLDNFE